jgi:hypothetical protein
MSKTYAMIMWDTLMYVLLPEYDWNMLANRQEYNQPENIILNDLCLTHFIT